MEIFIYSPRLKTYFPNLSAKYFVVICRNWKTDFHYLSILLNWKSLFIRRNWKRISQIYQRSILLLFAKIEKSILVIYRFRQIGNLYLFAEIENIFSKFISEVFYCYLPKLKNRFSLFTDFVKLKHFHFFLFTCAERSRVHAVASFCWQLPLYTLLGTGFLFYSHSPKSKNWFLLLSDFTKFEIIIYSSRLET